MANVHAKSDAALREVRAFGLRYPGTQLKSPWPDHCDLAVNDKTFAYLSIEGQPFSISCKLPASSAMALMLPNARPTEYGLGKSGWVTVEFAAGEVPPLDLVKAWIDESYRAQAPKKLQATVPPFAATIRDSSASAPRGIPRKAGKKKAGKKKAPAKQRSPAKAPSKRRPKRG